MKDWRDNDLSSLFLNGIRGAIPLAETQLEIISRLVHGFLPEVRTFLDLGCGDGILGRYIHNQYPDAYGYYLDYSEHMISELKKKLKYKSDCIFEDYSKDQWLVRIAGGKPFDLILSGYSIHHLEDADKEKLYVRIYNLLKPGGLFLNLEHVASRTKEIEKIHDQLFIDSLFSFHKMEKPKEKIRAEYVDREDKKLNKLSFVENQCEWLRETGFAEVDCYFKIFELALFGGIRPV
jgi:tRNA (cmo5U34)-methyltransferase